MSKSEIRSLLVRNGFNPDKILDQTEIDKLVEFLLQKQVTK